MTTDQKIQTLDILRRIPFYAKTGDEKQAQQMVIAAIKKDLTPREQLPLELTKAYIDTRHVMTTNQSWPDVMVPIENVRQNVFLYAIHVTRGGEFDNTWQQENKWPSHTK